MIWERNLVRGLTLVLFSLRSKQNEGIEKTFSVEFQSNVLTLDFTTSFPTTQGLIPYARYHIPCAEPVTHCLKSFTSHIPLSLDTNLSPQL